MKAPSVLLSSEPENSGSSLNNMVIVQSSVTDSFFPIFLNFKSQNSLFVISEFCNFSFHALTASSDLANISSISEDSILSVIDSTAQYVGISVSL